jgi:hypothetical protein
MRETNNMPTNDMSIDLEADSLIGDDEDEEQDSGSDEADQ